MKKKPSDSSSSDKSREIKSDRRDVREERFIRCRSALLELAKSDEADLNSTLRAITKVTARALDIERVSVWRFERERENIVCEDLYFLGLDRHEGHSPLAMEDYPGYFSALLQGSQVAADHARRDENSKELAASYLVPENVFSLLDTPIWRQAELAGVLCVERTAKARRWTGEERIFAAAVAVHASRAFEAAERRQAENELRNEKERLRNVLVCTNAGTWEWNVQTGEAKLDLGSSSILGYSQSELSTDCFENWMRLKHPDDIEKVRESLENHIRGKTDSYSFESRVKHKNGEWRWILGRGKIAEWDAEGRPLKMLGTHIDITEAKRVEEALRESEFGLIRAEKVAKIGNWKLHRDSGELVFSEGMRKIFGVDKRRLPVDEVRKIDLPEYWDKLDAANADLIEKGIPYDLEFRIRRPSDGGLADIHSIADYDAENEVLYGVVQDITDRKRAEKSITDLLAEKELILREVHHRIKNNMGFISSFLGLQAGIVSDSEAKAVLEDAVKRVGSMMLLYDKLYQSSAAKTFSAAVYLSSLVDEIISSFPFGSSVRVEKTICDFVLDAKILQPLGIIVNELLTNIMKYAFKGRAGGTIAIGVSREGRRVSLVVEDDGNGLPESIDFRHPESFGLMLIDALTCQIDGEIRIERGRGTKVVLEFETEGDREPNAK